MAEPKFSVSEITTFHSTYDEDLANYGAGGAEGVGIWEFKLPEGDDTRPLAKLRDSGLAGDDVHPGTLSIWPVPFPGPTDPKERTQGLCDAIRRFAPFEPQVISSDRRIRATRDPGEARRSSSTACARREGRWRARADARPRAAPPQRLRHLDDDRRHPRDDRPDGRDRRAERASCSTTSTTSGTPTTSSRRPSARRPHRSSVHVCDWRDETRNDFDRALPGDGIMDLPPSSVRSTRAVWSTGSISRSSPTTAPSRTRTSRTRSGSRIRSTSASAARRDREAWAARGRRPDEAGRQGRAGHRRRARAGHRARHRARTRRGGLPTSRSTTSPSRRWARSSPTHRRSMGRRAMFVKATSRSGRGRRDRRSRSSVSSAARHRLLERRRRRLAAVDGDHQESLDRIVGVNLTGAFNVGQAAAAAMVPTGKGGRIVFTSSVHAQMCFPTMAVYGATKQGLRALCETMAIELGEHGDHRQPHRAGLGEVAAQRPLAGAPDRRTRRHTELIPISRPSEPIEQGRAVVYLCSSDGDYVTGEFLRVDGGFVVGKY